MYLLLTYLKDVFNELTLLRGSRNGVPRRDRAWKSLNAVRSKNVAAKRCATLYTKHVTFLLLDVVHTNHFRLHNLQKSRVTYLQTFTISLVQALLIFLMSFLRGTMSKVLTVLCTIHSRFVLCGVLTYFKGIINSLRDLVTKAYFYISKNTE